METKKNRKDKSGVTLVELLVATLIGIIIFVSWLEICNPKPIRKESFRRLAVEQAAGYLDLMLGKVTSPVSGNYSVSGDTYTKLSGSSASNLLPVFPGNPDAVVGYTLSIKTLPASGGWPANGSWIVVELYDKQDVLVSEAGKPFFTLSAYIGGGS